MIDFLSDLMAWTIIGLVVLTVATTLFLLFVAVPTLLAECALAAVTPLPSVC